MTTKDRGAGGRFLPGNPHRFAKGVSGNPGGRPKLSSASRGWLARPCRSRRHLRLYAELTGQRVDRTNPPTNAEVIAARVVHSAITGKDALRCARELREATEGVALVPAGGIPLAFAGAPQTGPANTEEKRGATGADAPTT
ncbi:MAG TPA: DUF5681 domain-containing protein [Candidatus Acidoferrales bacterium]|nr:DUF5681 domain-containing protein [Candidatus Acidoferrales bacterium]